MIHRVREPERSAFQRLDPPQQNLRAHTRLDKSSVDELALFGGRPMFVEPLHVGRPNVPDRAALFARFESILDRGWLTNDGPLVREFEERVAHQAGVRHCVATSSGTMALQIAARAMELTGEVILPSLTFIATAHAMQWIGLQPVFADVDPDTYCLDLAAVGSLISPQTSAILGVHLWGHACDPAALGGLAKQHNLKLLFDAAHAFGNSHGGESIGSFGDAEVFSFHATKFVHAGEGGAVVTNDSNIADRARLLRNFGFTNVDEVSSPGINGRMNEFSAAIGLSSLEQIDVIRESNRRNFHCYRDTLDGLRGIRLIDFKPHEASNWQYVVVEIDELLTNIDRDLLVRLLQAEGVLARRYFLPGCHQAEPYRSESRHHPPQLKNTNDILKRVLSLPNGLAVAAADVTAVCGLIRFAIRHAATIQERLAAKSPATRRHSGQTFANRIGHRPD